MSNKTNEPIIPATYTVKEAARLLGLPLRTAYAYIECQIIPAIHLGHRILVLRRVVEELLAGGGQWPTRATDW